MSRNNYIYQCWYDMIRRCNNPNNKHYKDYGERGIKVCQEWLVLENFKQDMGERPTQKHSLDRIDNNKGYFKENCRWATPAEQVCNRRPKSNDGFIGITWHKKARKWQAYLTKSHHGTCKYIGLFDSKEKAVEAIRRTNETQEIHKRT